jgi:hypothetical protein
MSPRLRRIVAVITLLLAVVLVAVLTLRALGVPIALGPGTATPSPTASASAEPSSAGSPSVDEVLAAIESETADIRNLPPADIGPPEFVTRDELERRLTEQFATDYPPEQQAADNALYHALGILAPDQDYAALQLQLLASQVIGYYDDATQSMVIVSDVGLTPEAAVTYSHEYTHALQDAAFGMDSLDLDNVDDNDASYAALALVEGDATTTMVLWAIQNLTPEEILDISQTPVPDTSGVPAWMVSQLEFPYLAGSEFTSQLYARGDFSAVDEAWADPPVSTEQILHFRAYLDNEEPIPVIANALVPAPQIELVLESTFGEAMIGIWLGALGVDQADADAAAEGWGGDAISVIVSTDGTDVGMALTIAFDTPADADQFEAAYADAASRLTGYSNLFRSSETEVTVSQGTSEQLFIRIGQLTN